MFLLIWVQSHPRLITVYFNTSHVSINHCPPSVEDFQLLISIHLMFLLILNLIDSKCDCIDFNTSHVSINRDLVLAIVPGFTYFNTSHVSINLNGLKRQLRHRWNFNTSHVSINPTLLSAFPFLLYLKFLENTSFFKFFPSVSQT